MAPLIAFIVSAGKNVGKHTAAAFEAKGYQVALSSRRPVVELLKIPSCHPIERVKTVAMSLAMSTVVMPTRFDPRNGAANLRSSDRYKTVARRTAPRQRNSRLPSAKAPRSFLTRRVCLPLFAYDLNVDGNTLLHRLSTSSSPRRVFLAWPVARPHPLTFASHATRPTPVLSALFPAANSNPYHAGYCPTSSIHIHPSIPLPSPSPNPSFEVILGVGGRDDHTRRRCYLPRCLRSKTNNGAPRVSIFRWRAAGAFCGWGHVGTATSLSELTLGVPNISPIPILQALLDEYAPMCVCAPTMCAEEAETAPEPLAVKNTDMRTPLTIVPLRLLHASRILPASLSRGRASAPARNVIHALDFRLTHAVTLPARRGTIDGRISSTLFDLSLVIPRVPCRRHLQYLGVALHQARPSALYVYTTPSTCASPSALPARLASHRALTSLASAVHHRGTQARRMRSAKPSCYTRHAMEIALLTPTLFMHISPSLRSPILSSTSRAAQYCCQPEKQTLEASRPQCIAENDSVHSPILAPASASPSTTARALPHPRLSINSYLDRYASPLRRFQGGENNLPSRKNPTPTRRGVGPQLHAGGLAAVLHHPAHEVPVIPVIHAAVETALIGIVRHRQTMAASTTYTGFQWQSKRRWTPLGSTGIHWVVMDVPPEKIPVSRKFQRNL
ncbi:hypothetical protein DFH08DRAFT_992297 [Mycena albidolilacea]|uniref:Uncharacterized protein n=1 Tax=Mycena albidolilacea TaxID=1033008 RepID=A0AAD7E7C4_9AGAR|nr:hypothetical protein DFH08DRAFT_992297 [Mycena albidolilacea]